MNRWLKLGAAVGLAAILAGIGVLVWAAVAHQIHPSGDIGYGDIAVGVGTLILAVVTLGSVVLGWLALGDTRKELEAAQRPLLVPITDVDPDAGFTRSHQSASIRRPYLMLGSLTLGLRNLGPGPAANIAVRIIVGGSGEPDSLEMLEYVAVAGAGETFNVAFGDFPLKPIPAFTVEIDYSDVSSQWWSTTALFTGAAEGKLGKSYVDLKFHRRSGPPEPLGELLAET